MDSGDKHDGILETDFQIAYEDLNFEAEVAGGAFGKIFKGDYFGTPVAIKKFIESGFVEDDQKYIAREVATLKGIRHPCIVNFMGVCVHSSGVYIVTEWIPNGDLTNLLKNTNVEISWKSRVQMLMDAAVAMRYLHAHSIIHRDLKSENLLLTDNDRIKVCDLGFARTTKKLTRTMSVAGTELYMAPEVMLGEDYDEKCDVYSFGIVIFEVICRHPPPKRSIETKYSFPSGLLTQYMPPDCPPDLALLTMDCTQFEKDGRPSFEEVFHTLKELHDELEAEEAATLVNDTQEKERLKQERHARHEREQDERDRKDQEEKTRKDQEEKDKKARAVKEKREKELKEREKLKKKQQSEEDSKKKHEEEEQRAKERESQLRAQLEKEVMEKLEQEKKAIREQLEQEYAQKEKEREEREQKERQEREEREKKEREEIERRARDEAIISLASPRSRKLGSGSSSNREKSTTTTTTTTTKQDDEKDQVKKERSRSWALRGARKEKFKQQLKEEGSKMSSSESLTEGNAKNGDKQKKEEKAMKVDRRKSWAPMRLLEEKKKAKEEKKKREEEEKMKKKEEKKKRKVEKKIEKEEKKIEKENEKKHARTRSSSIAIIPEKSKSGSGSTGILSIDAEAHPFG